ncbi:MAG: coenzyme F420-0:L-glutamate ligase [Promethearchaeota archaeon]
MQSARIKALPVLGIPLVQEGDNIAEMILRRAYLQERDVLVIASKIVSKAEGRVVNASSVEVSERAREIADRTGFDPIHVELALREANEIVREDGVLITETKLGLVCNFSGVDKSNAPSKDYVLLPVDPDQSANRIQENLVRLSGKSVAVVISDTHGRPWRKGSVNIAIGCAGINAFKHNRGKLDLHGRTLKRSSVCQIDELASLVEPLMGQAGEKVPVVIVRGYDYSEGKEGARDISRTKEEDMFR